MKKKIITLMAFASLSTSFLAGCFGGEGGKDATQEVTTSGIDEPGHVTEEDGARKVLVYVDPELNKSDESGTFEYTVKGVRLETVTASTDVAARTYGIEKDAEALLLSLDLSAKNTGYESVNCYISQATLTTASGETVEPKSLLGDYIDGHFVAGQEKTGKNVYVFTKTKADDINNLTLMISAPKDNDFKAVGDEVEFEFNIRK